jgi:hypothetical protein
MKAFKHGPTRWAASMGAASLVALVLLPTASGASTTASKMLQQRGVHAAHGSGGSGSNLLVDHGGKILPTSDIYVIWWGNQSAWNKSELETFFGGLNGSTYVATGAQYMRQSPVVVNFSTGHEVTDPSSPPNRVGSTSPIAAEVQKELTAKALPTDPLGVYFVFTSNFPGHVNYCAWHSYTTVSSTQIAYAYMPNTANISGCNPGTAPGTTYTDEGSLSLTNVTAHEFMESITDASISAWYDNSGSEIGDKCAWQFNGTVQLANNTKWLLQEEWSNALNGGTGGCTETTP